MAIIRERLCSVSPEPAAEIILQTRLNTFASTVLVSNAELSEELSSLCITVAERLRDWVSCSCSLVRRLY